MRTKEYEKNKNKLTFTDRLAIFDKKTQHSLRRKNAIVDFDKVDTSFENSMQLYQPKKQNEYIKLSGDIRKREKRENKYNLQNEKDKNQKMNKTTISNIEYGKLVKNDIPQPIKNYEHKNPYKRKPSDNIFTIPQKNNVSEIIKIFDQKEEKNIILKTENKRINNKRKIKSKEKSNKLNNHNNNNNNNKMIENTKYIQISISKNDINNSTTYSNKSKNQNNYNKEIKEYSYKHSSKENKVLDTIQLFSKIPKKKEQDKYTNKIINTTINCDNKKKINNNNNIKDRIDFFNNDLNKSFDKKRYKININLNKEEENKVYLKHNKELKKNEIINQELHININNNNIIYEKQTNKINIVEKKEKLPNTKYLKLDFNDKNQGNNEEKIIKSPPKQIETEPPKISNSPKIVININKKFNKKITKQSNINNYLFNNEVQVEKKRHKNVKHKTSNSLPRIQTKSLNDNETFNTEYLELNKIPINSESKTNSFCKGFFIVSIPKKNSKILDDSEGNESDCGHEECSYLPAIDPEIIYKYPEKDTKELEINNILASICFPNLIKVCYCDEEDKIYTLKNYRTVFTNQVGDRYFSMIYHFYVRMNNNIFYKDYKCNLLEKIAIKYSGEIGEKVEEKTQIINSINNKKYIYIPYCICLVSKYPYFSQMEKCLQSIMLIIKDSNFKNNDLNEIISYFVNNIPTPYLKTTISFPIPNSNDIMELYPNIYQELYLYGNYELFLKEKISVNNFVLLFRLMVFEQKILFISDDYDNLTLLSLDIISLLYPLSWVHIYIPIITEKMLKYLESFLPFISGMHRALFEKEKVKKIISSSHNDLFIFDIDNNSFDISCNLSGRKKVNFNKFLNRNIPSFPKKIEELIIEQLNILKAYYKNHLKTEGNYLNINIKMKLSFMQAFIILLYDYKNYLTIIDDLPVFNVKDFLNERP